MATEAKPVQQVKGGQAFYNDDRGIKQRKPRSKENLAQLESIGDFLNKLVQDETSRRLPKERQWLESIRQYNGIISPEEWAAIGPDTNRSTVFLQVTRQRTNAGEARLSDMLFPTDDKNWGIKPTPVPFLQDMAKGAMQDEQAMDPDTGQAMIEPSTGEPVMESDLAKGLMDAAQDRAEAMEREIEDQLVENRYIPKCREIIHDAAVCGTGILKGPVIFNQVRKAWNAVDEAQGIWEMIVKEEHRPIPERVDYWHFFPESGVTDIRDAEYTLERHLLTRVKMAELAKQPGYDPDQIRLVLESVKPNSVAATLSTYYQQFLRLAGDNVMLENRYELWEYHGPISREDLYAINQDLLDDMPDDVLTIPMAHIWFVNNIVVKGMLSPYENEESIYSVYCWEKDEAHIMGYGVPYLMRNSQRVINGAWRMLLDNAALSTGPQIVLNREVVEPADGRWELTARKLWLHNSKSQVVGDAFQTFHIDGHTEELLKILDVSMDLADEESGLPLILQGDQSGEQTKTKGGLAMLQNNANVVTRRQVKNFDDDVTKPIITRYYDFNMQFNPKSEIKGDMTVDARGTSVLLVKEIQSQNLLIAAQNFGNPVFAVFHKPYDFLKKLYQSMQIPPEDVLIADEEADQLQPQMQQLMLQQLMPQPEQAPPDTSEQDAAAAQMEADLKAKELEVRMYEADRNAETKQMELAVQSEIKYDELQVQLAEFREKNKTERDKLAAELRVKREMGSGI